MPKISVFLLEKCISHLNLVNYMLVVDIVIGKMWIFRCFDWGQQQIVIEAFTIIRQNKRTKVNSTCQLEFVVKMLYT